MTRLLSLAALLALRAQALGFSDQTFDAVAWIQTRIHGGDGPDANDLQELQSTNPEAYALVKALLVKNSLGLIRRKSFPAPEDGAQAAPESSGGEDAGAARAVVPATIHKSFFGWKAPDDSAAVQSVLGEVAGSMNALRDAVHAPPVPAAVVEVAPKPLSRDERTWKLMSEEPTGNNPNPVPEPAWAEDSGSDLVAPAAPTPPSPPKLEEPSSTDDIFAKGASQVQAHDPSNPAENPGGKEGAFWSGLFTRPNKPKKAFAVGAHRASKKQAAFPATEHSNSYLKGFNWDSDDDAKSSDATSSSSNTAEGAPGNSYMHFLD